MRAFISTLLFLSAAKGVSGFSVTTSNPDLSVKENEGVDLTCSYSADFGSDARTEWKFKDKKGSQSLVVFDGKLTQSYESRATLYGGSNLRFSKVTRVDTGEYSCEVSSSKSHFASVTVRLTVLVPPSVPFCRIPQSATTGTTVRLFCDDPEASPPPTYQWYKDGTLLPANPSTIAGFKNATYKLNSASGELEFPSASLADSGQYYCVVSNSAGPSQKCSGLKMDVRDINTGGIVAGVIVALLLVALLVFSIWYAKKKGYLPKKSESKQKPNVVYQSPSSHGGGDDEEDGEFKQKSSFVV
ncbi:F11 receptor, tandem duplicate 1 [Melanotaenia boesemani]|uniref:F11 receptor, tandem duplicate 1 n=1 Tax=Melanotaenia boesemani TaxID=1250792 RepID=UPI001C04D04B|nr:F11 receptor, tandem duplicate 1 [Melanotaenia boesemani]